MKRLLQAIALFVATLLFSAEGMALKDSNCTGKYSVSSQKIILPYGYYVDYVKKSGKLLPHKVEFEFNSSNIDTGYIYCMGVKKGASYQCINNLDKIVKSNDINYVTVEGKKKTYFLLNKKESTLNFNLPLVNALTHNSKVSLNLLRHKESIDKEVCQSEDKELILALEPFKASYEIKQTIASSYNKELEYKSSVTVNNPQGVNLKLYDLYSKKVVSTTETTKTVDMSVFNNKLAGFCLKLDNGFSQLHLKEGQDYFCETTTFGDFNFAVFHDALNTIDVVDKNNAFLQVGSLLLTDIKKGELPFELLGIEKSARLIRQGYKDLKTTYIGDRIYILVGPFNQNIVAKELRRVKKVVPDAILYDEDDIKCKISGDCGR